MAEEPPVQDAIPSVEAEQEDKAKSNLGAYRISNAQAAKSSAMEYNSSPKQQNEKSQKTLQVVPRLLIQD